MILYLKSSTRCNSNISLSVFSSSIPDNEIMDSPMRHECPCRETKFMIGSYSRSSTGNVARVYPSRTLVSLMGCKRAEGVYMANERMSGSTSHVPKEKQGEKMCRTERGKSCSCTNQINHSHCYVAFLAAFSLYAFFVARLFPPARCKLRRELRFPENCIQQDWFFS